jgi:hypothetical protein
LIEKILEKYISAESACNLQFPKVVLKSHFYFWGHIKLKLHLASLSPVSTVASTDCHFINNYMTDKNTTWHYVIIKTISNYTEIQMGRPYNYYGTLWIQFS